MYVRGRSSSNEFVFSMFPHFEIIHSSWTVGFVASVLLLLLLIATATATATLLRVSSLVLVYGAKIRN